MRKSYEKSYEENWTRKVFVFLSLINFLFYSQKIAVSEDKYHPWPSWGLEHSLQLPETLLKSLV